MKILKFKHNDFRIFFQIKNKIDEGGKIRIHRSSNRPRYKRGRFEERWIRIKK